MDLRPFQTDIKNQTLASWNAGQRNVLAVLPTGAGKSITAAAIVQALSAPACVIAHREELTSQMALALAKVGVRHRIIGRSPLVKSIVADQMSELGHTAFDPGAQIAVAGVDTLVRRADVLHGWLPQVRGWVIDEAHHVLQSNKWGTAVGMFPHAYGLGVTATPLRADGRGLGRHSDGVFDAMHVGPSARELIDAGFLADYMHNGECHIYCPPNDVDVSNVSVGSTGDYVQKQLKAAVRESHIVGDIVTHYQRICPGKLAVVFATDIETAGDIAARFRHAGVSAEAVSGKTPTHVRADLIRRFRAGEIRVLVNCDLFGEGFDLPALEVAIMARPTQSYGLYCQQFGRALRPCPGKSHAIIIDHVGNVVRHGLPDTPRAWSLDGRDRKQKKPDDELALTNCPECTRPYEKFRASCPHCGYKAESVGRGAPEQVEGDLSQLDPATIAQLRARMREIDGDFSAVADRMMHAGAPRVAVAGARKQHGLRADAQKALRESMSWWAGREKQRGRSDAELQRLFFLKYGVDVMTAQTLGRPEALALAEKINISLGC